MSAQRCSCEGARNADASRIYGPWPAPASLSTRVWPNSVVSLEVQRLCSDSPDARVEVVFLTKSSEQHPSSLQRRCFMASLTISIFSPALFQKASHWQRARIQACLVDFACSDESLQRRCFTWRPSEYFLTVINERVSVSAEDLFHGGIQIRADRSLGSIVIIVVIVIIAVMS